MLIFMLANGADTGTDTSQFSYNTGVNTDRWYDQLLQQNAQPLDRPPDGGVPDGVALHRTTSAHAGMKSHPLMRYAAPSRSESVAHISVNDQASTMEDQGTGLEASVEGAAPPWPFRGVVNYATSDAGFPVMQYWNIETNAYSEVQLASPNSRGGGCPSWPVADHNAVEFSFEGAYLTILRVPWGDHAYPQFVRSTDTIDTRSTRLQFGQAGEISIVSSKVKVVSGSSEKYYLASTLGLSPTNPETAPEATDEGDSFIILDGTDGYHWGLRIVGEAACPLEWNFIFDIETGEMVACGWTRGGAFLIAPSETSTQVEAVAFPDTEPNTRCDEAPMNLNETNQ